LIAIGLRIPALWSQNQVAIRFAEEGGPPGQGAVRKDFMLAMHQAKEIVQHAPTSFYCTSPEKVEGFSDSFYESEEQKWLSKAVPMTCPFSSDHF
jgi:hypothetical protein